MNTYVVTFTVEVDADDPDAALTQAQEQMAAAKIVVHLKDDADGETE